MVAFPIFDQGCLHFVRTQDDEKYQLAASAAAQADGYVATCCVEMKLPKAVFITPIHPSQTGNGLAMRMGMFLEAICQFAKVDLILVPVAGGPTTQSPYLQRLGVKLHVVPVIGRNETHFQLLSRLTNLESRLAAFKAYGKPSLASYLSSPVLEEIRRIIGACQPDFVHIGRSYLAPCISILPDQMAATLDLDEDDFTSFLSQARLHRSEGDDVRAEWMEQEGRACDSLICRFGSSFKLIFVASHREAELLRQRHAMIDPMVIQNAVTIPRDSRRLDDGQTLLFVGALSYRPNIEGIVWFARAVLPRLRSGNGASCRILVAGAQPPAEVTALDRQPRVHILGHVSDLGALYRHSTLALAPLHSGGGTRIKLLEAASYRVASIATTISGQGIGWPLGSGGWLADKPREFASACREALNRPSERDLRGSLSHAWVRRCHDRNLLMGRIARIMHQSFTADKYSRDTVNG